MATIALGSMVIELDLDGVSFIQNTRNAETVLARLNTATTTLEPATRRLRGGLDNAREGFELTHRRAERFATEGLGLIEQVVPGSINLLGDLARKSTAAGLALQALGVIGVGVAAGAAMWELQTKAIESYVKSLQDAIEEEKKFQAGRAALVTNVLATRSSLINAETQLEAIQLRRGNREIEALEAERKGALAVLDIGQRRAQQELARLQSAVRQDDDNLRRQAEIDEQLKRFATDRARINADADAKTAKARDEEYLKRRSMEQLVIDAAENERQARLLAIADIAAASGRLDFALRAMTEAQVATARAAAAKELAGWQDALQKREIDEVTFNSLRVQQAATTAAKLQDIETKVLQQRRANLAAAAQAVSLSITVPDVAAAAQKLFDARQALENASRVRSVGGFPDVREGVIGGALAQDLAKDRERLALWDRQAQAARELNEALIAQERNANRPRLFEGLKALDDLQQQLNTSVEQLAVLEREGAAGAQDLWLERSRVAALFRDRLAEIRTEFAGTPAVIEAVRQRFAGFEADAGQALDVLVTRFLALPRGLEANAGQFSRLTTEVRTFATAVWEAVAAVQSLDRAMVPAGAGQ